jgi:hypothetical protein
VIGLFFNARRRQGCIGCRQQSNAKEAVVSRFVRKMYQKTGGSRDLYFFSVKTLPCREPAAAPATVPAAAPPAQPPVFTLN